MIDRQPADLITAKDDSIVPIYCQPSHCASGSLLRLLFLWHFPQGQGLQIGQTRNERKKYSSRDKSLLSRLSLSPRG